jgi:hypothetical protein
MRIIPVQYAGYAGLSGPPVKFSCCETSTRPAHGTGLCLMILCLCSCDTFVLSDRISSFPRFAAQTARQIITRDHASYNP